MKHGTFKIASSCITAIFLTITVAFCQQTTKQELKGRFVSITLKEAYDTKVTITPFDGLRAVKSVAEFNGLRTGESCKLFIPEQYLPGEFVIRFDYRSKESDTPYPSEKNIFINQQDIELSINPPYCNNIDSTKYKEGEQENTVYNSFMLVNSKKRLQIDLLKQFLLAYDQPKTKMYKIGCKEFENRRNEYNQWLKNQTKSNPGLFVGSLFQFQYISSIVWGGSEDERLNQLMKTFFEGIDFNDTLIIRSRELNKKMSDFMGLYGIKATSYEMRDSMFTQAGRVACEKASKGHPKVYGWMVDYFYNGYETYKIDKGMIMLQQHLENPNCLTSKKQQILKRLEGMKNIAAGNISPDFTINDSENKVFNFYSYKGKTKNKLLLFWSADCSHCEELTEKLNKWYSDPANQQLFDIVAISLDETDAEVSKWENKILELVNWKHLRAKGGVNSDIANNYAILSTPVIILIDSNNNIIKAVPNNFESLLKELGK